MKVGKPFNTLSLDECLEVIDRHKEYSDFNTLGLYRSILENERLSPDDRIMLRDHANRFFEKTYYFLQLKDPWTFFHLSALGREMTRADDLQLWKDIRAAQQKILKDKQIRHRSFGEYSKHNCGHPGCPLDGLMIRPGSGLEEFSMFFHDDVDRQGVKDKSKRYLKERKNHRNNLRKRLDEEE